MREPIHSDSRRQVQCIYRRFALPSVATAFVAGSLALAAITSAAPPTTAPATPAAVSKEVKERIAKELEAIDEPGFAKKPPAERAAVIDDVFANVVPLLPTLMNGTVLAGFAGKVGAAHEFECRAVEIWGEDAKAQAVQRPVTLELQAILARAEKLLHDRSEYLLKVIQTPDDPKIKLWEKVESLYDAVVFEHAETDLRVASTLPKSDPHRAELCQKAMDSMKEFAKDDNGNKVAARVLIGKCHLTMGRYDAAREMFKKGFNASKQEVAQEFDARRLTVVADLQQKGGKAGAASYEPFLKWLEGHVRLDPAKPPPWQITLTILEYRIKMARSEEEADPGKKASLRQEAEALLKDLATKRPELRGMIEARLSAA